MELNVSLQNNPYAKFNVLYDSIWAVALTINRSLSVLNERNLSLTNIHQDSGIEIMDVLEEQLSQLSFQGATGWLNFSHSAAAAQISLEILQIQNGQLKQIGSYYGSLNLNISVLGVIPSVTLDCLFSIPCCTYYASVDPYHLYLILITISMHLFIYYCNEPIATSNTLSCCLFVGCYFLLTSSLFHTITKNYWKPRDTSEFICIIFDILIIGSDIIFAMVISKIRHIYHNILESVWQSWSCLYRSNSYYLRHCSWDDCSNFDYLGKDILLILLMGSSLCLKGYLHFPSNTGMSV